MSLPRWKLSRDFIFFLILWNVKCARFEIDLYRNYVNKLQVLYISVYISIILGYTGWDCTDISNIIPTISLMSIILLITSNVFFVPAIYVAIKRKLYAEGLVYLVTMLFSSLYHACDENGRFCITKYEVYVFESFSIFSILVTVL